MSDTFTYTGIIRVRQHPFGDDQKALAKWWFAEWSGWSWGWGRWRRRQVRLPRMSDREKDRYTVYEAENILTTAGRTQLLNYIGNASNVPWGKIFSVGTFPLVAVSPGDTTVNTELVRVATSAPTVTGTQVDIPCSFTSGQGNALWTNIGLYGTTSATTTLATGTLYTHALFQFNKPAVAEVIDYLISLT